ncbi:hypothetical protein Molly5_95 [Maribacter phage Molly_5]|uniref:Uncharacterized protein n=1 Tax=Maribacter phage Molly_1 TaxID=2745685 RepID=A0A8E4UYH7_9CAUD|nr:hypothetical protein M1M29_gp095 [Maribacter phage Molly_1]QQO97783.1 hypothetical protein Molly2_95 [Maribacter phage Molly_2]QQO97983.1 hypothetical protein Molly3_95 [Maribacter phage Molly_3]QQO98183.1 hypothetical protein Molly4_95 [Maribacter phage Molly_4]QQO98383.1 hypothetical protein Molly5_95 [Maribacter phage Molly_5]QQO97583.1 hypothetical protein Molly1_95 [Maribacter phage Molly_1]
MHLPSREIPRVVRESNSVFIDITDFFDKLHVEFPYKDIQNLYDLLSYKSCDNKYLDFFLYDLGLSTSQALTPAMKRCIIGKWDVIQAQRFSTLGLEAYLGCMLAGLSIDFIGSAPKNFIQPNLTTNSFGNSEMVATAGLAYDQTTYIYSPAYREESFLSIKYDDSAEITFDLLNYINSLLELELPLRGVQQIWTWTFLRSLADTYTVDDNKLTFDTTDVDSYYNRTDADIESIDGNKLTISGNLIDISKILLNHHIKVNGNSGSDSIVRVDQIVYIANRDETEIILDVGGFDPTALTITYISRPYLFLDETRYLIIDIENTDTLVLSEDIVEPFDDIYLTDNIYYNN